MCRPPDLAPTGTGLDDALEGYPVDGVDEWNEGNLEAGDFEGSDIAYATLLGKRDVNNEGRITDAASRAAKFPRAAAPVSSAFDSAAASFMAKMEQSMLEDLRRQQNQRRLAVAAAAAAAAPEQESLLVQRALLEQRNQLQQLQQLQLLKQLQRSKAQAAALEAQQQQVLPEQQHLLLAQQQLLQQSQSKLFGALAPAAVAPAAQLNQAAAWAALANKAQAPAASLLPPAAATAEAKIQAWMQAGVLAGNPAAAAAAVSSGLASKNLPTLHPKPAAAAVLAAAGAGAELNSAAAAMFGLGHLAQSGLRCGGMVVGEEKKAKRMQSNRASAKRSRQRRQARLEELDKTTAQLHEENNTVVVKLEEAQKEIVVLEEKNRGLQEEVSLLRKMLGMEALPASAAKVKAQGSPAASGAQQQSCVESEGGTLEAFCNTSAVRVKGEAESEVALGDGDQEEDDGEEEAEGNDCSLDWLGNMPLSPVADMKPESPLRALLDSDVGSPALDQFFVQGDVFSELLACLDG